MKKLIFTLFVFLVHFTISSAQQVEEKDVTMSFGKQTSFMIEIDGVDRDMTKDVWKKFVKDYGKGKRNKKAKEYYSLGAVVPVINGSSNLDMYLKFEERVGLTNVYMWVDFGGEFVNSNDFPKEAQGVEDFLQEFRLAVKKKAIGKEMKNQEKEMKKMEKSLRKLEKKNTGYHKDIEKAKEKIEDAEKNIEQNLKDQEDERMRIAQQQKVLEEIIERLNNLGKS